MYRFFLYSLATVATVWSQSLDEVVIPRKTEIFFTLERSIGTKTARSGDKFYGHVSVPITQDDQIVIPVGTYLIGHVETSSQPGYVKGKSQLRLAFDTVILPDGTTRQLEAIVASAEGYQRDLSKEQREIEAAGSQSKETAGGAAGGTATGAGIGALASRSWKGAGVGAAIGAAGGALLGLFQKGQDVTLPKGTSIVVQLESDVRFVKPTSRTQGVRLDN